MKHRRTIGKYVIVLISADDLDPLAEDLLTKLEELNAKGPPLRVGSQIAFGWTVLTLEQRIDDELGIREPDFSADAEHETTSGADVTLRVLKDQLAMCKVVGAAPQTTFYTSEVRVVRGAMDETQWYLQREPPESDKDSGWRVGSVAKKNALSEDFETLAVWQIYQRRPEMMDVLALPVGFLATFFLTAVESIVDPHNREVYRAIR